jgi:hypothetical protein
MPWDALAHPAVRLGPSDRGVFPAAWDEHASESAEAIATYGASTGVHQEGPC